jgi:molybdopterin-guanine dinucleotide biosynthesis protein A
MGRDKALLEVAGVPLALRVAHAMLDAGAKEVLAVGGNLESLRALGLRCIPDELPFEGPLGGIISALRVSSEAVMVVTACDMPWLRSDHMALLVSALGTHDVVMSASDGQPQPLQAAWTRASLGALGKAFSLGERSPLRAIRELDYATVDFGAGPWSIDLDTPDDFESIDSTQH